MYLDLNIILPQAYTNIYIYCATGEQQACQTSMTNDWLSSLTHTPPIYNELGDSSNMLNPGWVRINANGAGMSPETCDFQIGFWKNMGSHCILPKHFIRFPCVAGDIPL